MKLYLSQRKYCRKDVESDGLGVRWQEYCGILQHPGYGKWLKVELRSHHHPSVGARQRPGKETGIRDITWHTATTQSQSSVNLSLHILSSDEIVNTLVNFFNTQSLCGYQIQDIGQYADAATSADKADNTSKHTAILLTVIQNILVSL